MVKSTIIARVVDGLPLAASMDDEQAESELAEYKSQAKAIFKKLNLQSEPMCSIDSGPYYLHYLLDQGVCYLCICDKSLPRKLAFSYLDELSKEFYMSYGSEIEQSNLRPYAFIKFDTFIQKTKRIYEDSRTQQNMTKLNEDLRDVTQIMTKNMEDLLWRGDSLDRMSTLSYQLRGESEKYRKATRRLNLEALYRKYGIPAAIILGFILVIYLRYKLF
ncbi:SNAP receptor [Coemansia sp. BCRC 34490]|nr:SNAP receptor [Coemansia sp. Benny D160-2]KAJ2517540.1 SNAP receptor [Coemansia sp. RSA 1939]KAJ2521652.1 SNAP receptor [Coemansia sp. RSA 2049]KAJ2596277.1 SNAP receptor [Coemansia sp. RSA 1804]KAJ2682933.1 SNAP receptor [Coemansia sp. RSA 1285]KAJ2758345.1 SNAP receptor [Coemansia sp. BCRC 34490]